jgi:outer membrane protein OmpA-like peptidoglycan-associated protein
VSKYSQFLILIGLFISTPAFAQDEIRYYVTIGAFGKPDNAKRLVKKAKAQGYKASYALNPAKKLHYVYILNSVEKRKSFLQAIKLRVETEYKDAWVFIGKLEDGETKPVVPVVEEKPKPIETIPEVKAKEPDPIVAIDSSQITKPIEAPVITKPTGRPFYIKLINEADGSEVKSGEVHIQEAVKATQYQAFKPGEIIYLDPPKNPRGSYALITQVAGYKPVNLVFNYQSPIAEKGGQDEFILEIPVTKAKKGDYVDFANVKFLKNASILQPAAQNELDGLVDLLKENLRYKIKVHGFVNGDQSREAFTRGPNSSFFGANPTADITTKKMSAKELSTHRAETVRDYLISQGIDASRISVKGEGGKIPLYPEGGSQGPLNDRVEIEFTKH